MPTLKYWLLHTRLPPNLGESAANLQSFVAENVHVTVRVTTQLHAISDFDVTLYVPRVEQYIDPLLIVADLLDFLRQALGAVLSVGLSPATSEDLVCLDRVTTLSTPFTPTAAYRRTHTLSNILLLSTAAVRGVMNVMVNDDLSLWSLDDRPHALRAGISSAGSALSCWHGVRHAAVARV